MLDTHVVLWAIDGALTGRAEAAVRELADAVVVSAASLWEIEIKRASGRLQAPDDMAAEVEGAGFERLPIDFEHAVRAGRLPPIHGDPFDRMLVAQAQLERLTLVTGDAVLARYDVPVLQVTRA